MNLNLLILLIGMPALLALLMAANKRQDMNIIQEKCKLPDDVRAQIRDRIRKNESYRKSDILSASAVVMGPISAGVYFMGAYIFTICIGVAVLMAFIIAIYYRYRGFVEVAKWGEAE